jgi:hypothetical protein
MTAEKPGSRLRNGLVNLGVSLASLAVFLLFCEFVLFRFVLPGSDVPRNDFVNEVVRYAPNQSGIWRVRNEIAAPFSINAKGWNSPLADYPQERRPGVRRVAVVGDSFVEALQVPVGRSFAEVVQAGLAASGPAETYRFGLAGAPHFFYRWQVRPQALVHAILGRGHANDGRFAANIDVVSVLSHEAEIRVATDYVFARLAERARSVGAKLLIVVDGDRHAIYAGHSESRALVLNRIAAEAARRAGIAFLDLHPVFAADWAEKHQRFDFEADAHWNENGHAVAGAGILEVLKAQ